jgi:hypothetical protein
MGRDAISKRVGGGGQEANLTQLSDFQYAKTLLNKQNRVLNIAYVETPPAAELEIQHIYSDDFRITVTNNQRYVKTYFNQTQVYLPLGENTVIIDDGGMITTKEVVAQKWRSLKLNYSDELRARLHNPAGAGNNGR